MKVERCRGCLGHRLQCLLDLGHTALANRFVSRDQADLPEPMYPLRLALCADCGLVQIEEEVPAEQLFADYIYVSGTSDRIHSHAAFLTRRLARHCGLREGDLVLEVASNDGTVLRAFQSLGVRTVGIEPAANIAERANQIGIETECAFFDRSTAARFRQERGLARLILARHVLAHVSDLHGFVHGLRTALADDGLVAVEVPHLAPFYTELQYDTIYHEHLCYFSVQVLQTLFQSEGLELVDVVEIDLHGGSILVSAQKQGGPRQPSDAVERIISRERQLGLGRLESWQRFAERVTHHKSALVEDIGRLRAAGRTIAGYGAPAKGMTLLAFCGIGPDQLPYLVDRSPYKQGLLTPGHHIPVYPPERLLQDRPDVLLLLAWNFADEIVKQQAEYEKRGGAFLLPIPGPHYWDSKKKTRVIGAAA